MYTSTTLANPSQRAHTLSLELTALVRARRAQDLELGVPDALVALELSKAPLLSESGVTTAQRRAVAIAAALLISVVASFLFFLSTP